MKAYARREKGMQTRYRYDIMTEKSVFGMRPADKAVRAGKERVMEKMEELLHILEKNARLPLEDIAAMMDVPATEAAALLDEAKEKGYVRGYQALVDWEKAGVNQVEAVIELHVSPRKDRGFEEIAATIAAFEEVDGVMLMSGGYDLLVTIKGQSFQQLALFVAMRLSPLDDVLSTATSFVLRPYKRGGILFQDEEIDERECTGL